MGYEPYPLAASPEDLIADIIAAIKLQFPDWEPNDGNLDTQIIEAFAAVASDVRDLASDTPDAIFRYFGATVLGILPLDAIAATVTSTWVAKDDTGYVIEPDTQVAIYDASGNLVPFTVVNEVVIDAGDTQTAAGEVILEALTEGEVASGIGGVGIEAVMIDPLEWVTHVYLVSQTTGGQDAEMDSDYLDRLAVKLQTMSPRPILPGDFATIACDIAGVVRSVAIDGYDPGNDSYNNERMVTVASIDDIGAPVSADVKAAVLAYEDAQREVSFVVNVMDPKITPLGIYFEISVASGYDAASVLESAESAMANMLDPTLWGIGPEGASTDWTDVQSLRINDVIAALSAVSGVSHVTLVEIGTGGTSLAMRQQKLLLRRR